MRFKPKGFTLIELLVVITIMAIMALIALPNMSQWLAARRVSGQAEQVANLLRFARAEAVRLNAPVYVCPVQIEFDGNPDHYCNTTYNRQGLAAFADNGQGLAAFADIDKNGAYSRTSDDIALRAVILNTTDHTAITYQANTVPLTGSHGSQHVWGFLPNGTFGYGTSPGVNNLSMASGSVRIFMTDAKADTDEAKQARASTLLIDSGGRVSFCLKKDEKRSACAEPAKEK